LFYNETESFHNQIVIWLNTGFVSKIKIIHVHKSYDNTDINDKMYWESYLKIP
jgi:hypothetical protein